MDDIKERSNASTSHNMPTTSQAFSKEDPVTTTPTTRKSITMVALTVFTAIATAGIAVATAARPDYPTSITWPENKKCGEVNVIFTGFPPHHVNLTINGNWSQAFVDQALRTDAANAVKAGYNIHVIFQGLEQPASNIADRMKGKNWDITGVGFGQRSSYLENITHRVEDVLILYRENAPRAPNLFNWSPTTFTEALKTRVPLAENCTDKPGKLLAYEEVCTPEYCPGGIVITNGSISAFLNF